MGWGKAHLFASWLLGWVLLIHLGEPISTQPSPPSPLACNPPPLPRHPRDLLLERRRRRRRRAHSRGSSAACAKIELVVSAPFPQHDCCERTRAARRALNGHLCWQPRAGARRPPTWHPAPSPCPVPRARRRTLPSATSGGSDYPLPNFYVRFYVLKRKRNEEGSPADEGRRWRRFPFDSSFLFLHFLISPLPVSSPTC